MVCLKRRENEDTFWQVLIAIGVDACNTALGVLIFAAAMNLGQTWTTVLTLFGCEWSPNRVIERSSF